MERKYECFLLGKISVLTYDTILECSQPFSVVQFLLIGSLNMLDNFNVVWSITKTLSKVACMQAILTAFSIIFCLKCTEHRLLLTGINPVLISVDVLCIKGLYFTFLRQQNQHLKVWLRFSVNFKCILNKIYSLFSSLKPQNAVTKKEFKKLPILHNLTRKESPRGIEQ